MYELIDSVHPVAQEIIASIIVALTAVVIFLIARLSLPVKQSLLAAFIFAFCTSAWSTASRALWQHGPSMLMLSISLFLILLSRQKPALIQYASIPLAYSFVIRPTNAISVVLLTAFVIIVQRKFLFRYFLWSLIIAFPFFLINSLDFLNLFIPIRISILSQHKYRIGKFPDTFALAIPWGSHQPLHAVSSFTLQLQYFP